MPISFVILFLDRRNRFGLWSRNWYLNLFFNDYWCIFYWTFLFFFFDNYWGNILLDWFWLSRECFMILPCMTHKLSILFIRLISKIRILFLRLPFEVLVSLPKFINL